jgi:hypothetical protein
MRHNAISSLYLILSASLSFCALQCPPAAWAGAETGLWTKAKKDAPIHRFSTLFTAHDVKNHLSKPTGLEEAIAWCRQTAVTKVYIEEFRDGYRAEKQALERARDRFRTEGFEVSGCVTTTRVGKASTGWKEVACCYTDPVTQSNLQSIFEYAAGLFDEIMIDDFWFTDCACVDCDKARQSQSVTVADRQYPVHGDTWENYRCELMVRLSRDRVIAPARKVNPRVRFIIKYPQWYDNFHNRGYEVLRETQDFDRIWVGTETRDFSDQKWGGTPQYEAYFIMRWLGDIGRAKCGGGWYDPYGTTESTYLEQARQTVLGGAHESLLFCYSSLQNQTGPKNIAALRTNISELLEVAAAVKKRHIVGVAAYKPANSHPEKEARVFDFIGMLGVPLVPCQDFPTNAPAAFFSIHSLKDAEFTQKLQKFLAAKKPVLLTDGLAQALTNKIDCRSEYVHIVPVHQDPKSLLDLKQADIDAWRAPLLKPFKTTFTAMPRVALYLFKDGSWVVENFNDQSADITLNGNSLTLPPRAWRYSWK